MVSDRAFLFHMMCVPCVETFSLVPKSRSSVKVKVTYQGHIKKKETLTLALTSKWKVIELSYFECVFQLVTASLCYQGQGHMSKSNIKVTF